MDAARQAERLDHQRGDARRHRRQRPAAAHRRAIGSGDPRRRQAGRRQSARLPRRLRRRARQGAAGENPRQEEDRAPPPRQIARTGGGLDLPGAGAADRASKACAGWSPIRASAMRGSISTGCEPLRRGRRGRRRAGQAAQGSRAPSRRAHVLRGRGARGAGQDRAGAHARASRARNCASKDEPFSVHDFLKPGIEELCQLLPPLLARPILALAERRGWLGRVYFGMEINATSIFGYLRFLMLAKLRRAAALRPPLQAGAEGRSNAWLALIAEAARHSTDLALEVAECARLIKGYGDTHARGTRQLRSDRGARDPPGAGRPHPARSAPPTRSPARAPPRWSIPRAKASPNAWPRSRATAEPSAWRRSKSACRCQPLPRRVKHPRNNQ